MRLDLKYLWPQSKDKSADEFRNLRDSWNAHDGGYQRWTSLNTLGSLTTGLVSKTSVYSIGINDHIVLVDTTGGAVTVTLPTAVGIIGRQYVIKCSGGSKIVTVATTSGQTIDGGTSAFLPGAYYVVRVVSDGSNWMVV